MKHVWILNHPAAPAIVPKDVYYCSFCGCWTANRALYANEVCERRAAQAERLEADLRKRAHIVRMARGKEVS